MAKSATSKAAPSAAAPATPRLLPSAELPRYTYVPGAGVPHPIRDPKGHSYGRKYPAPPPLEPGSWAENRSYLWAIDLFNFGFYWEAHEEWERLWRSTGADSLAGRFLKGLIKLAAAGVKVRERSVHGVRRHAASAGEVFADVAAETAGDKFCGLELTYLQFAADRAAQLSYKEQIAAGKAIRVFPFLMKPDPMPWMV
jgi:predicted metal-dependent hydrolase